jgi:hypothetical protein
MSERGRCRLLALVGCLVLAAAIACDETGDNYLEGSLTDSYSLGFDSVRIRLYTSELSIEYIADSSQGEKVALRITLEGAESLVAGTQYDLKTQGSITQGEGFGSPLPELQSGDLKFSKYSLEDGSSIKGKFNALFLTDNGQTLTLRGGFADKLEVVVQ